MRASSSVGARPDPSATRSGTVIERYAAIYGPYAFGVLSLIIIWFLIVRPELQANRAKTEEIQKVAETMRTTAETMRTTADTMRGTAELINQAVARLERLEKR